MMTVLMTAILYVSLSIKYAVEFELRYHNPLDIQQALALVSAYRLEGFGFPG
jgi:hypothetical protein